MFSHVTIGTNDLGRAAAFYDAVLAPLGIERVPSKYPNWAAWRRPVKQKRSGLVGRSMGRRQIRASGCMTAFAAPSRTAVDAAYTALPGLLFSKNRARQAVAVFGALVVPISILSTYQKRGRGQTRLPPSE